MSLCTHDIDALRHARHIQIQEADGAAAILALGGIPSLLAHLASSAIPFIKTVKFQHTVDVQTSAALGASPARGGTVYYQPIQRSHRADWTDFTERLQEGDNIRTQWEREGKALLLVLLRNGAPVHQARFERVQRIPRPWRRRPRHDEASAGSAQ